MLRVLITIDTETHPLVPGWKQDRLAADMKRDLYGQIDEHAVGLEYQLNMLSSYGLRASFMVESLFSAVPEVGEQPLRDLIHAIIAYGNDVQLHPHTEWIQHLPQLSVAYKSHLLSAYNVDEQEAIVRFSARQLERAGAPAPSAFRAAGFAANSDTLRALARCGIHYDSSFNRAYESERSGMPAPLFSGHVTNYNGVQELPIATFQDYHGHFRPAQLCACSSDEMIYALDRAAATGWDFFVIVSHTFEMLARRRHSKRPPMIRWEVVERFERLCQFLSENRHRFETTRFTDIRQFNGLDGLREAAIKGKLMNTVSRLAQQALSRIHAH